MAAAFLLVTLALPAAGFTLWERLPALAARSIEKYLPGIRVHFGPTTIHFPGALDVRDIRLDSRITGRTLLAVDRIRIALSLDVLTRKRVEAITITGGELHVGAELQALFSGSGTGPSGKTSPWVAGMLKIDSLDIILEDTLGLAPDVLFTLNTSFTNLPLGETADAIGGESQRVEMTDLEIRSPYDPLTQVIHLKGLACEFTLAGLAAREIAAITITTPSFFLGPDLFWYMDQAQQRFGGDAEGSGPGWVVKRFTLVDGRLVLGSGSGSRGLPLTFRASAEDASLANLASLRGSVGLEIPARDYHFPNYQIELATQSGELRFAYPPELEQNNLVGTIRIDDIRWRQYRASNAWLSVTFDSEGINGLFGGETYQGYSKGGFSFFFNPEAPWIGWIGGKGVDLQSLTNVISPENFRMTGPLEFSAQVDARKAEILRLKGDFHTQAPGTLTIRKLDDLLSKIPPSWPGLKRDSTRIALETLRDFEYAKCKGEFWFVDSQGILNLALEGPRGSRAFEVVLHEGDSPAGRWKQKASIRP